mmetsp:Transcript_36726/g.79508  ORF Transcript_36726/g.79508 Transcript_36726/m.79508 type:complete len:132 (+) Transcript_36726:112-507(+)
MLPPISRALRRHSRGAALGWALMSTAGSSEGGFMGPMAKAILAKVGEAIACESIDLRNDSHLHAGHTGNPTGAADAETHFKLKVVSEDFHGKRLIQRHRMVNEILKEELQRVGGIHALQLKLHTPAEVKKK